VPLKNLPTPEARSGAEQVPKVFPWLPVGLAFLALAVASVAMMGLLLDLPTLATLGRGQVSAPPLGLILVGFVGVGVVILERQPVAGFPRGLALALCLLAAGIGAGAVLDHAFGRAFHLETWLSWGRGDIQFTSYLTDLALTGAGLAALARWLPRTPSWRHRQVSAALALLPLMIGCVVLISYIEGAPVLYGSDLIPMSVPSALCSVALGLSLLTAAGWDTWPLAAFGLETEAGKAPAARIFSLRLLGIFLLLGVLVLSAGSYYLRSQLRATRARVQTELTTIADFKVRQIADWHAERLGMAQRIHRGKLLTGQVTRFLEGTGDPRVAADLQAWFNEAQKSGYRRIELVDRQGRVRIAAHDPVLDPVQGGALDVDEAEVREALQARELLVKDLHLHSDHRTTLLNIWVPVGATEARPALGAILLMVDPRAFLYPLVQSWPTSSPSAETLLVRRDGEDLLYLNDLRHQEGTAMNLRMPLAADPGLSSARAALGEEGLVEGRDYRGVKVLAVLRRVPGTTWHMEAKVDEAEVYGPLRRQAWVGGLILIGLVTLIATGLGLLLRYRDADMVRRQLGLSQRFEWLMHEANDAILVMDHEGHILEANARAMELYGRTSETLVGVQALSLCNPETRAEAAAHFEQVLRDGSLRFESRVCRKDGAAIPVETSASAVRLDGELKVISFTRDISERKAQEREIQRMTQLYSALSQVNQAIVWSPTRQELFRKISEVMVVFGRFSMAWIAWNDPVTHQVTTAARYGDARGVLDRVVVRSDDSPEGRGAVGMALRMGCPCVINDFLEGQESQPWRDELRASNLLSVAAFPIRQEGEVCGALVVYASETDFFGTHESALLEEAAMDISYALDNLAGETRRSEAETALQESERFLMDAQEAGGIGTYTWYIQEDHWKGSPFLDRIFGIGPDHPRNLEGWTRIIAPEFRDAMRAYVAGIIERRERFDLEYPIVRASDGVRRWVHGQGDIRWSPEGQPLALVGIIQDIDDRKLAERALQKVSVAVEQSPLSVVITDPKGGIEYVNPAFTKTTGYSKAEAIGQNPRILKSPGTRPEHYRDMWETLARGEVWVGEFENLRKNREPFFEWATIAPVCDEHGELTSYIAIKEDITRQKRELEERRLLEAQLHQSQKLESLGSLAGGVAHDMNNVLGAILGLASTLRETASPDTAAAKGFETIMNACLRGRGVVKSLLYFAHKDLQEEQPIDLNVQVREMNQLLAHTLPKQVEVKLDLEENLGLVRGDAGALSHAIMNLCVNAVDAMPEGGTLLLQTARAEDGGLTLRVRDTGLGMSAEVLAKAMEPFFTTKPQGKGTGLGLAMVYGTVKAHDGTFDLRSMPGQGTEATLRFPASRVLAYPEAAPQAGAGVGHAQAALRVLLVDDDELIRDSVTPMLEMLGHEVVAVPGGPQALRSLEAGLEVDLVILDMNMPGMSGAEALPLILALRPDMHVLVATGYSDQEIAPLLENRPLVSSIRKPFSMKELEVKLADLGVLLRSGSPS